jgi:molybdate transport system ATP-binding protein
MSGLSVSIRKRLPGFDLDVGWAVRDGFTVLFGYSGAGKSLTLGALAGTMRPDEGRVRLGDDVLFDSLTGIWVPPQKRHLGYVPQNAQLFPHMTVRRNIEFALKGVGRGERAGRVGDLLARMHISELAENHPHQL